MNDAVSPMTGAQTPPKDHHPETISERLVKQ